MKRLFILLAALMAVLAAPIAAPAMAAVSKGHCEDRGHSVPATAPDDKSVMNHQVCCVAVDPGRMVAIVDHLLPIGTTARLIDDRRHVSTASGTDPPPPRLG